MTIRGILEDPEDSRQAKLGNQFRMFAAWFDRIASVDAAPNAENIEIIIKSTKTTKLKARTIVMPRSKISTLFAQVVKKRCSDVEWCES